MKRFFALLLCFCLVGMVAAYNTENYPEITPENAMNLQEVTVLGNGAMNDAVAWSPDGTKIVVGGDYGFYYLQSLNAAPEFIEYGASVSHLFFASDSLVFFSQGGTLLAYDLLEKRILYAFAGIEAHAVSNNGQMLAYETVKGIQVVDIESGNLLYDLNYEGLLPEEQSTEIGWLANDFTFAQFTPNDDALIVSWQTNTAVGTSFERKIQTEIWRLETLEVLSIQEWYPEAPSDANILLYRDDGSIFSTNLERLVGNVTAHLNNPAYVFDGNNFALLSGTPIESVFKYETYTEIWDSRTEELIQTIPETGRIVLSPDGSKLAINRHIFEIASGDEIAFLQTASYELFGSNILEYSVDGNIRVLDSSTRTELSVLSIVQSDLGGIAFTFSEKYQVLIHKNLQIAYIIEPTTGQEISRLESDYPIFNNYGWWFNDNERFVLTHDFDDNVSLWNVATGELVIPEGTYLLDSWFHHGDSVLIRAEEGISLYNPETEAITWTFPYDIEQGFEDFRINEPYVMILLGTSDKIYNFQTHELLLEISNPYGISTFPYPNTITWYGDRLAYLDEPNEIVVVSLPEGELIQRIERDSFGSLYFYDENTLELEEGDISYKSTFYDISTGEIIPNPRPAYVAPPCIETDNLNFFCNGNVRIETKNGREILQTYVSPHSVDAILSHDGSQLLIDYGDGTISVWAVRN